MLIVTKYIYVFILLDISARLPQSNGECSCEEQGQFVGCGQKTEDATSLSSDSFSTWRCPVMYFEL